MAGVPKKSNALIKEGIFCGLWLTMVCLVQKMEKIPSFSSLDKLNWCSHYYNKIFNPYFIFREAN